MFQFRIFRAGKRDGAQWRFEPSDGSSSETLNEIELFGFCFPEPARAQRALRRTRVAPSEVYCFAASMKRAVEGQRKPALVAQHGFCLRVAAPSSAAMGRRDLATRAPDCLVFVVDAPPTPGASHAMIRLFDGLLHMAACVWLRGARKGPGMLQRLLDAALAAFDPAKLSPASPFVLGKHMFYCPGAAHGARGQIPLGVLFGASFAVEAQLQLIAAALCERRLVFVSTAPWRAASCVHALNDAIAPFVWQHIFLPVVPDALATHICSPTPLLVGITRASLRRLRREGMPLGSFVLADVDAGTVALAHDSAERRRHQRGPDRPLLSLRSAGALGVGSDAGAGFSATKKAFGRRQHGELNCERLRKDLVVHRKDLAKTGSLDEAALRCSILAFLVRVFRTTRRYVRRDARARSDDAEQRLDVRAFAEAQPDVGVRELLASMEESQCLHAFAVEEVRRNPARAAYETAARVVDESMSWEKTKAAVRAALNRYEPVEQHPYILSVLAEEGSAGESSGAPTAVPAAVPTAVLCAQVRECSLCTVTFHANRAHSLTRSP